MQSPDKHPLRMSQASILNKPLNSCCFVLNSETFLSSHSSPSEGRPEAEETHGNNSPPGLASPYFRYRKQRQTAAWGQPLIPQSYHTQSISDPVRKTGQLNGLGLGFVTEKHSSKCQPRPDGVGMQWTLPVYFEQGHFGCQVPNRDRIKRPFSKRLVTHESPCQLSLFLAWPPVKSKYSSRVSIF